jgi:hypothetical protein
MKQHIVKVEFDANTWDGKMGEISEWCCENFTDCYAWKLDWQGLNSRKQWLLITENEQYAALFALRWS